MNRGRTVRGSFRKPFSGAADHELAGGCRTWEALSKDEVDGLMGEFDAQLKEVRESGDVACSALSPPGEAKTVRVRDGVRAVTDGPFAEAKELAMHMAEISSPPA